MKPQINVLILLSIVLTISACAVKDIKKAKGTFQAHMQSCTDSFGYDPYNTGNLPDDALANGELEYLECIYSGIESILIPNTSIPKAYTDLISSHKIMTLQVVDKKITRTERKVQTVELITLIKAREREEEQKRIKELEMMADDIKRKQELERLNEISRRTQENSLRALNRSLR